jgi:integrase
VVESTPKSHKARVIDLDAETVAQLRAHRATQDAERAQWGADYLDRNLVVAKENGEPIHPHTFSQTFERLVENANLRRIRLHDLRHYVDGWVMWPAAMFPLLGLAAGPVPAT